MSRLRLPLALVASLLLAAAAWAEPVFPPGSRIGLVPPPGMVASASFQGFEDGARRAMLVVTELSAQSYAKVERDFTPKRMQQGGMETLSREAIALAGGPALLIVARATENGVPMRKWALLTQAEGVTAIVIASMPEAAREAYPDAALHAALGSVVVRARLAPAEMLAVLPYRLDDLGGFRLLRASPDGTAVLTLGPDDTTLPVEQPYFMVALRAAEPPQPSERERFAQRVLMASSTARTCASSAPRRCASAGRRVTRSSRKAGTIAPATS